VVPEALRTQLMQVFETRFNRTAWLIKGRGGALIEVALDVGEVRTQRHKCRRAQPADLRDRARTESRPAGCAVRAGAGLGGQFDCLSFDISKAERGVRLAHGWRMRRSSRCR